MAPASFAGRGVTAGLVSDGSEVFGSLLTGGCGEFGAARSVPSVSGSSVSCQAGALLTFRELSGDPAAARLYVRMLEADSRVRTKEAEVKARELELQVKQTELATRQSELEAVRLEHDIVVVRSTASSVPSGTPSARFPAGGFSPKAKVRSWRARAVAKGESAASWRSGPTSSASGFSTEGGAGSSGPEPTTGGRCYSALAPAGGRSALVSACGKWPTVSRLLSLPTVRYSLPKLSEYVLVKAGAGKWHVEDAQRHSPATATVQDVLSRLVRELSSQLEADDSRWDGTLLGHLRGLPEPMGTFDLPDLKSRVGGAAPSPVGVSVGVPTARLDWSVDLSGYVSCVGRGVASGTARSYRAEFQVDGHVPRSSLCTFVVPGEFGLARLVKQPSFEVVSPESVEADYVVLHCGKRYAVRTTVSMIVCVMVFVFDYASPSHVPGFLRPLLLTDVSSFGISSGLYRGWSSVGWTGGPTYLEMFKSSRRGSVYAALGSECTPASLLQFPAGWYDLERMAGTGIVCVGGKWLMSSLSSALPMASCLESWRLLGCPVPTFARSFREFRDNSFDLPSYDSAVLV